MTVPVARGLLNRIAASLPATGPAAHPSPTLEAALRPTSGSHPSSLPTAPQEEIYIDLDELSDTPADIPVPADT